eukprot:4873061-Amphidinium_carterae.2
MPPQPAAVTWVWAAVLGVPAPPPIRGNTVSRRVQTPVCAQERVRTQTFGRPGASWRRGTRKVHRILSASVEFCVGSGVS